MTDKSIIFDFTRVDDFMDNYNIEFQVSEMDGVNKNYEFVFSDGCPDNIGDCLDEYGGLNNSVHTIDIGDDGEVPLLYTKGVNGSRIISLGASDVTIDVGDVELMLKALFLRDLSSGYVMAYSILGRTIPITNQVIFPATGIVWTIRNEG